MSEANDQPVVEAPNTGADAGVAAEAPATTTTTEDDIETEDFDRVEAPDEDEVEGAGDGQSEAPSAAAETMDDDEEVELADGRKVKVPKEVALGMLRDADYRKKTQTLAEERRAHETERAQQLESLKALRTEHLVIDQTEAQLSKIEEDLGAYRQLTAAEWAQLKAEDPAAYDRHMSNFEILRTTKLSTQERLDAAKADLKTKESSLSEKSAEAVQANLRTAWSEANVVLSKDIPGWGPEKFKEIGGFVVKEFGVKEADLGRTADPVAWKMANALMVARAENARLKAAQTQAKTAATTQAAAKVVPAAKPAVGAAQPRGLADQLDGKEWLRRREAQVARKRA